MANYADLFNLMGDTPDTSIPDYTAAQVSPAASSGGAFGIDWTKLGIGILQTGAALGTAAITGQPAGSLPSGIPGSPGSSPSAGTYTTQTPGLQTASILSPTVILLGGFAVLAVLLLAGGSGGGYGPRRR